MAPAGQALAITRLNLKTSDIVARATSSQSGAQVAWTKAKAILQAALTKALPSAYADNYPLATTAQSIPVSRKLINGQLFPLEAKVAYMERDAAGTLVERTITCDLSSAEVNITSAFSLNTLNGDLLVRMAVPGTVHAGCELTYRDGIFVVLESGATFEVSDALPEGLDGLVPANDPAFNQSPYALLVTGNVVKTIEVTSAGSLVVKDLTTAAAAVLSRSPGDMAFNGSLLVAASAPDLARTATFFVYQKDSTAFRILRPGDTEPTLWSTNGYLSTILDDQGQFLFHYASNSFRVLQTSDLSFSRASGPAFPSGMYGAVGRRGRWILSDRGVLWNYETGEARHLARFPDLQVDAMFAISSSPAYSRVFGNHAYIVDANKARYIRYDIDTGIGVAVDVAAAGYLPRSFTIYKDYALVEVVNTANSDRKYVQVDFATSQVTDLGVIAQGARKVVEFVPIGATH